MRLLELFSGTGSVRKAVGHMFDEVVSLDILPKFNPTECCDILSWDYKKYPPGYFNVIWASPPCTHYSKAKTTGIRNFALADSIVKRTLEIIEYFAPTKFYIENPQTGLLKDREFMWSIPYVDADYCCYGFSYRKRTRFWTNVDVQLKLCDKSTCPYVKDGSHINSCGNGYSSDKKTSSIYSGKKRTTEQIRQVQKYGIPADLIKTLFDAEP